MASTPYMLLLVERDCETIHFPDLEPSLKEKKNYLDKFLKLLPALSSRQDIDRAEKVNKICL
jgi:hypothetical protein